MSVREATAGDISAIARIHKARFSTHFLGQYSVILLGKLYEEYLGRSIFLVHETKERVDGFVLGGEAGVMSARRKTFVRSNLLACIWETFLRPRLCLAGFRRALNTIFPRRVQIASVDDFRLLSIAVDEEAAGTGVATELLDAFEARIRVRASDYGLSVHKDNPRAVRFYGKSGFREEYTQGDSIYFRKQLGQENADRPRQ